jgi:hypothetical protein
MAWHRADASTERGAHRSKTAVAEGRAYRRAWHRADASTERGEIEGAYPTEMASELEGNRTARASVNRTAMASEEGLEGVNRTAWREADVSTELEEIEGANRTAKASVLEEGAYRTESTELGG